MNKVQEKALYRLNAIPEARKRIEAKIAAYPESPKAVGWKKRLAEYDESIPALEYELKTGRKMQIGGVVVEVPAGSINLEAK